MNLGGHIDLIVDESKGRLVIWDYKPPHSQQKWNPDPNSLISESFIQYIPQVAAYALTLMYQLGIKGLTCGIYNEFGSWEFDPFTVMKILNIDFSGVVFPWNAFRFLNIK